MNAFKRIYIDKSDGGQSPLGILMIKGRVVQMAIKFVTEPIFENEFNRHSYGFRPTRSAKDALREVNQHLRYRKHWAVDPDTKGYFDVIDHEKLRSLLQQHLPDQSLLSLIDAYLCQEILSDTEQWKPLRGSPQGAVLSPLLASIYFITLDDYIGQAHDIMCYINEFVILCHSQEEAEATLSKVRDWMGGIS